MKKLTLILIITSVFLSCKKKDNKIVITGTITDVKSGIPAANIPLSLYVNESQSGSYNNNYELLESTTTNSDGVYKFSNPYMTAIQYQIRTESQDYFNNEFDINPQELTTDSDNTINYTLYSRSYYKIAIKNNTPYNSNDEIVLSIGNTDLSNPDGCGAVSIDLVGGFVDTLIQCPIYGGQTLYYSYVVTKNSISNQYTGSVYCPAGDTANATIAY